MKNMKTDQNPIEQTKAIKPFKYAEFDFASIEKRIKELKELEKKLLAELEKL
jgi:hypothetical protein